MATLDMLGPFELTAEEIDDQITRTSPGNYALGHVTDEGKFHVNYVGRSDNDINQRLKQHVDEYDNFKYSYAASVKSAFEKECHNYHDFGQSKKLANTNHPARPEGSSWECPVCDIFD